MELKVGMYVRTKVGIFKIRKITKDLAYWKHEKRVLELDRNIPEYNYRFSFYKDESIFKGAKFKDNIIDLIEVGDYVNGHLVTATYNPNGDEMYHISLQNGKDYILIHNDDEIKSILTHEQYEANCYKVVE